MTKNEIEISRILTKFCKVRAEIFLEKVSRIVGVDVRKGQDVEKALCRAMVAWSLILEGYNHTKIAAAMGIDRNAVLRYRKRVEYMLNNPEINPKFIQVYRQLNERRYDVYYRSNQKAVEMGGCVPDSSKVGLCQRCDTEKRRGDLRDLEVSDRNKHDLELQLFTLYQGSSEAGRHKVFCR